jgi:hypothetical protein
MGFHGSLALVRVRWLFVTVILCGGVWYLSIFILNGKGYMLYI